jgi:hypothetical protein
MSALTKFDYLLNAFERASQHAEPASQDYVGKRRELFAYVRQLEQELTRKNALFVDLPDIESDIENARCAVACLRCELARIPGEIADEIRAVQNV